MKRFLLRLTKVSIIATVVVAAFSFSAQAIILSNGGFDTVGPTGPVVTTFCPVATESAAANWKQWAVVPSSQITTELCPSTDLLSGGGGNMLHVITDVDLYSPAHCGNGFSQDFGSILPNAQASFDLFVVSGQVTAGLVLATGPFANFQTFGPTGGWIHVVDTVNAPVQSLAFETLTLGAGAEYYVDNARVIVDNLDIILNQATFTVGQRLTVAAHVTNGSESVTVEAKVQVKLPTDALLSIVNIPQVTIPPHADLLLNLLTYQFTGSEPVGVYECGGRFLNWITGDILNENIETFTFQPQENVAGKTGVGQCLTPNPLPFKFHHRDTEINFLLKS